MDETAAAARLVCSAPPSQWDRFAFAENGFLGPIHLFTARECERIAAYLHRDAGTKPAEWVKGRAVGERILYDLATIPPLLDLVTQIVGTKVVLWGAQALVRRPGEQHPWHSDIESASPAGGFVTAWVGIENTCRDSALQLISRSHRLNKTVQQERHERAISREFATAEQMLSIAREQQPSAQLVQPEMDNGDVLLFDGRLWHGSINTRASGNRLALLLQYAAADRPVYIPDFSQLDWPFRFHDAPRPPVILVAGRDGSRINRLVPPPAPNPRRPMIATAVHQFNLNLADPAKPWQPFPAFRGATRTIEDMSCHASVLIGGHSPHVPHSHREEEVLIPLHGDVEVVIAASPDDPQPRAERLKPGSFVFYPSWQHHTIRNPGVEPVSYLMFKWDAPWVNTQSPLPTSVFHFDDAVSIRPTKPFWTHCLFEAATDCLGKLHAHVTVLQPGAGYDPHVDAYDVAIVVLSGTIETLGKRVQAPSVVYYSAGEPHGMLNVGPEPAQYLVFEFHRPGAQALRDLFSRPARPGLRILRFAKRLARPLWRRIKPHLGRG